MDEDLVLLHPRRRLDTADQIISRDELRSKLLPAAPERYRAIIATAAGAGRRAVPLPAWLVPIIRDHLDRCPTQADAPVYANAVGKPLRRTLFRARVWSQRSNPPLDTRNSRVTATVYRHQLAPVVSSAKSPMEATFGSAASGTA